MSQATAAPVIPDFDVFLAERKAEVSGKKKEKKRFGLPWYPNLSAVQGLGLSARLGAYLGSGLGVSVLSLGLAATAGAIGFLHNANIKAQREAHKKKQFETSLLRDNMLKRAEAMRGAGPTIDKARNDTIGFVTGGGLPGEGVGGAGAGDGAASGSGAGSGDPNAEGKGAEGADGAKNADGAPPMDANAMAAQMMGQMGGADPAAAAKAAAGAANAGIGKLSQGLGGMRGGGGMSGGVNRGFDQPKMSNQMLAKAEAFKGPGQGGAAAGNRIRKGNRQRWEARGSKTSGARHSNSANRLRQMAADMAANRGGDVAKTATANTAAWDSTKAPSTIAQGPSNPVTAGGAQTGGGGGVSMPQEPEGGPVNMDPPEFDAGDLGPNVPTIPDYKNATPYQWAVDLAKMLIYGIIALGLMIAALRATGYGATIVPTLINVVAIMGGVLAALGVYMIAMEQYWQGTMYTVLGAIVAGVALAAPEYESISATKTALASVAMIAPLLVQDSANEADTEDFRNEEKDNYRKKYGVDPETKRVLNREKFDGRYGEGAADKYDEQRKFDDMR